MEYTRIDTKARGAHLAAVLGLGDLSSVTEDQAIDAERSATALEVRLVLDRGNPTGFLAGLETSVRKTRALADALAEASGADTAPGRSSAISAAVAVIEERHFDAAWREANDPGLSVEVLAGLRGVQEQADQQAAMIEAAFPSSTVKARR